ncbi:putative CDP-diglyceride synthetase/phosphatidate cytidylyltransferase [Opitutaceae bacterium TAV1]|nr:putative CDP-diglyceride synthetase/phosphatidate cytidylyltransferase [Opitutaceae bacterium TAV1]
MAKRTFSTLSLWLIILGTLWFFGTRGAAVLAIVVSVFTQLELYRMLRRMGHRPFVRLGLVSGALVVISPVLPAFGLPPSAFSLSVLAPANLLALSAIASALLLLGRRTPENRVESLGWTLFGIVYVPFLLQFLVQILLIAQPHASTGLVLGLWVIATSKFCDVGALLTGMAFGKHRMAPVISPKKTWEGAAGGVITSALVGAGIAYFCRQWLPVTFTPLLAAAMAAPVALLGIVSDLVESIIKRRADTKDSGATIPGIGGMFDLSDSLLLTSPAAFILFSLFL